MNHHTMKTNETDTTTATATQSTKSTVLLSIDKIRPNPNNPRRSYDENALAELAASIATHGLIQPIRVRAAEQGGYIIVCGERRYRAVQLLGQTEIEAIVDAAPADERAIFDLALSENIQREEMPSLDEAEAYKAAMQTLGGDAAAVEKAGELALQAGAKRVVPLKVSGPFHTSLMAPAGEALAEKFRSVAFGEMSFPVLFNCKGGPMEAGETIPELLVRQVQSSVYMEDSLRRMAAMGLDALVEIGPGKALSGFVKKTVPELPVYAVETAAELEQLTETIKGASL